MTRFALVNARLIDPEQVDETEGGLVISEGLITQRLAPGETPADLPLVDCAGKCLAPGIVDIGVKICEPGERHKESYGSAGQAAAAGGVTTLVTRPDTNPAIDTPETLELVRRRAKEAQKSRRR